MYNEKICQRLRAKIDSSLSPDQENGKYVLAGEGFTSSFILRLDIDSSGPTQLHSCCSRAWIWDRTLHFGDKSWNSEHTVLKKPIQPDEPKVPDDSWRSWRRHTQCERSCLSPQQHGRTRIIQVPLPNYLSDKKCKCISRDSVKCSSRCKNHSCHNPLFPLKFWN